MRRAPTQRESRRGVLAVFEAPLTTWEITQQPDGVHVEAIGRGGKTRLHETFSTADAALARVEKEFADNARWQAHDADNQQDILKAF